MTVSPDLSHLDAAASTAVALAYEEAKHSRHRQVGTEHLLLGLIAEGSDTASALLHSAGVLLAAARDKMLEATEPPGTGSGTEMVFTARAARALERAIRFAFQRRTAAVGTVYLLLGILDVEGTACQVLRGLDVDLVALRAAAEAASHDPVTTDVTSPQLDLPARSGTPLPTCPSCGGALDHVLAYCRLPASDSDGHSRELGVAYCRSCSRALGVWPS